MFSAAAAAAISLLLEEDPVSNTFRPLRAMRKMIAFLSELRKWARYQKLREGGRLQKWLIYLNMSSEVLVALVATAVLPSNALVSLLAGDWTDVLSSGLPVACFCSREAAP
jgi:hypothetical protein